MTLPGPSPGGKSGPVHALVLAAGGGKRFGGRKLHAHYQGRPLLSYVLAVVEGACRRGLLQGGCVVIAAGDGRACRLALAAKLEPVVNQLPERGLSNSLRLGLTSLERRTTEEAGAALVLLGDQPLVRPDVIEQLVRAWQHTGSTIIRPRYSARGGAPGHPVLLSHELWPRAWHLEGDVGFSALLDPSSPGALTLDVTGDNPDVDTRADLQALGPP